MPLGPGKYDKICEDARKAAKAVGAAVMIYHGEHGDGFSLVGPLEMIATLPNALRIMAKHIEDSTPKA